MDHGYGTKGGVWDGVALVNFFQQESLGGSGFFWFAVALARDC